MAKTMFADVADLTERLRLLNQNCDSKDTTSYTRNLTQEELDFKRELHVDNCIQLNTFEDELKVVKAEYKEKMEPLQEENKKLLRQVKTRQEELKGTIFNFADHVDGMMYTYDENGDLVGSRRLKPEEKQAKLFPVSKVSGD